MKFLVLLLVLVAAWLIWRHGRLTQRDADHPGLAHRHPHAGADGQRDADRRPDPKATPGVPQEMVRCAVCGVHLPRADATEGTAGRVYCGAEHRRQGEA